ncbi:hypothetical protein DFR56_103357 [Pseudogracilibacillus auburnensis]|uniref:Uncharacterized protein n=1 Tax=Pseudogracilibacillus auburnensis TaxID=1494959 RepID=A0A2V3W756_9BACI|nr:hypothetical protein DFR56_103357 [Pseudogracilibacillus auburnensis]
MEISALSLYETLVPFLLYLLLVLMAISIILKLLPMPRVLINFIWTVTILASAYYLFNKFF